MREIVLDTETTGLDPAQGHRIVEIGAVELLNHIPSGRSFHKYMNPERDMPPEAEAVHGLGTHFLKDQPLFGDIVEEFLAFVGDAPLVIHNAAFDLGFLNAELAYARRGPLLPGRVTDTLQLARRKHPMGPNSLDALCKRYAIDSSRRTKHGALLDSELLAEVYLELVGGRQTALTLTAAGRNRPNATAHVAGTARRQRQLPSRLSDAERESHGRLIESLGETAVWKAVGG